MTQEVFTVDKTSSVLDACKLMREREVGLLMVVEDGRPKGLFAEQDVISRVVLLRKDPAKTLVEDVMTTKLYVERTDHTLLDASLTLQEHGLKRVPVVDDMGKLVGILSSTDIVRILAEYTLFDVFSKE